ncbi:MAG: hypothetical protein INQ03_09895 [Candidatus Heimdallarchaeota archaeon]|nr:hypothetical protein [Candidatus Heimdallarchaeota archaeon]
MKYLKMLKDYFPKAVRADRIMNAVEYILLREGLSRDTVLFGNSTCPDEINQFILSFAERWGENFSLGGLAGFPFTGETGFKAYSSHAPDDGSLFILYASHIGINEKGELGRITRKGMTEETYSCGSSMTALKNFREHKKVGQLDFQQGEIIKFMQKHGDRIESDRFTLDQLPKLMFEEIDDMLRQLIKQEKEKKMYLLGGIQINTHHIELDYFVPLVFELVHPDGENRSFIDELREMIEYSTFHD